MIDQAPRPPEPPFYADRTVVCPDKGAVDHVGGSIALDHICQGFEHCLEHAGLDPASIAPEDAIPLAEFIRRLSPLCAGARHHIMPSKYRRLS
ncbi:hypothetical protein AAAK29_25800 [Mesorhizobium sp. CCNWLW179-1]|uniref:hypothetical protein n=1 Tax=Mesorhizobium sp. CCNWLW179-1 TaxID=3136721 RepID=UPI0032147F01